MALQQKKVGGHPVRTYVVDTSVLLSDPQAFARFAEHDVVLPAVVLTELESKRHDPNLGYYARTCLRALDDLRLAYGGLSAPVPVNEHGGHLHVDINHADLSVLPSGFRDNSNDARILAVAANLAGTGAAVTVVSKDLPMRVKASAMGLPADQYLNDVVVESGWTGVVEAQISASECDLLYEQEEIAIPQLEDQPVHTGVVLTAHDSSASALGRITPSGKVKRVAATRDAFGLRGRSAEQRIALDLLLDPQVGIISLGGRAGTGKSALALCAGLEAVMEQQQFQKIMVFRPLYAVGEQNLGYLPGSESEKMAPWSQAVMDTLSSVVSRTVTEEIMERELLEVLPLTHIRGRTLHDAFVIVDEAQSLERNVLITVLSRIGHNARVVLTHDVAQRDNLRVGRFDGVAAIVEILKGHPLFAHIELQRSERSAIAALVNERLAD